MKSVRKVAVSLPAKTLDSLEQARHRLGKSRSALVAEAIELWLSAQDVDEGDQRYIESYLRHPERVDEKAMAAAIGCWEPWN